MILKNKKTGETGFLLLNDEYCIVNSENTIVAHYNSLKDLSMEWEDVVAELNSYWCIDIFAHEVETFNDDNDSTDDFNKEIGNYFRTKEEAKQAVEKLKAFQRLKDRGFKFDGYHIIAGEILFKMTLLEDELEEVGKDMEICFVGKG